jgi:hypothetical protein
MQRAKAQSKTGIFRDCGVAEETPGFQAGWSGYMYFSLFSLFVHFVCSSGISVNVIALMRVQCCIETQPRYLVVGRSVSLPNKTKKFHVG